MTESFAAAIEGASGQAVLSGATLGGFAYDDGERGNGVFTAAVLDGLRGQATADGNGFITVHGLGEFVQRRVAEWVRRHRPEHAEESRGIGQRLEGPVKNMPLAVDPEHSRAAERYRVRREKALLRLRDNLGRVLNGALYDEVVELLPAGGTGAAPRSCWRRSRRWTAATVRPAALLRPRRRRRFWSRDGQGATT